MPSIAVANLSLILPEAFRKSQIWVFHKNHHRLLVLSILARFGRRHVKFVPDKEAG